MRHIKAKQTTQPIKTNRLYQSEREEINDSSNFIRFQRSNQQSSIIIRDVKTSLGFGFGFRFRTMKNGMVFVGGNYSDDRKWKTC